MAKFDMKKYRESLDNVHMRPTGECETLDDIKGAAEDLMCKVACASEKEGSLVGCIAFSDALAHALSTLTKDLACRVEKTPEVSIPETVEVVDVEIVEDADAEVFRYFDED